MGDTELHLPNIVILLADFTLPVTSSRATIYYV